MTATATDYAAAAAPGGELALLLAAIALCAAYLVHAWAAPARRRPERTPEHETPTARHDDRPATDPHPRPRGADRPPFDQERQ